MNRRKEIEGEKKNLSRAFVLPMVGINYKQLPRNFVNCYITKEYECVLIFDKTTQDYDEVFYHFENNIKANNRHFVEYQDLEDEVVMIFKIPTICKHEFDLFIEGSYSKFSEPYKKVIYTFFGRESINDKHTVTEYNALYPEDFKRKQIAEYLSYKDSIIDYKLINEVLHKPDMDRELFKSIDVVVAQNMTI